MSRMTTKTVKKSLGDRKRTQPRRTADGWKRALAEWRKTTTPTLTL